MFRFILTALGFAAIIFLVLVLGGALTRSAPPTDDPVRETVFAEGGIGEGIWLVEGAHAKHKHSGAAIITKFRDVYHVQYSVNGNPVTGVGIFQGRHFSVGWIFEKARGVSVYKLAESGKSMVGRWTSFPGDGTMGYETLTFLKQLPQEEDE